MPPQFTDCLLEMEKETEEEERKNYNLNMQTGRHIIVLLRDNVCSESYVVHYHHHHQMIIISANMHLVTLDIEHSFIKIKSIGHINFEL